LRKVRTEDIPHRIGRVKYIDFTQNEKQGLEELKGVLTLLDKSPQKIHEQFDHRDGSPFDFRLPTKIENFVDRPEEFEAIKKSLLNQTDEVAITAILGMGGIGKTALATMLCYDPDIERRFSDGILWLEIGQRDEKGALLQLLVKLTSALGSQVPLSNVKQGITRLVVLLQNKRCLIVLDNVWNPDDILDFKALTSTSSLLITSRDAQVAKSLGAQKYELGLFSLDQSKQMLEQISGQDFRNLSPHIIDIIREIIVICGNLPIALGMIASNVEDNINWWQDELERLRTTPLGSSGIFANIMERSLSALTTPSAVDAYFDIAIFPKGEAISESALKILWKHKGFDWKGMLRELRRKFLLRKVSEERWQPHDLQHDYVLERARTSLIQRHNQLLHAYKSDHNTNWADLDDDGYIYDHLVYHLENAQRFDEILALFTDEGWASKRSAQSVSGLIADFERAALLASQHGNLQTQVRYAIFSETVRNRYETVSVEVIAEAIRRGLVPSELLAPTIRSTEGDAATKVRAYLDALRKLPENLYDQFAREALILAEDVNRPEEKAHLIQDLLPYLHDSEERATYYPTLWRAILEIDDWKIREPLLEDLLPTLTLKPSHISQLRDDILRLFTDGKYYRAIYSIEQLSSRLEPSEREATWASLLNETLAITNDYVRADVFAVLLKRLEPGIQNKARQKVWEVLDACQFWEGAYEEGDLYDNFFGRIFEPLIQYLLPEDVAYAWNRPKSYSESHWRGMAMAYLTSFWIDKPTLPETLHEEMIQAIPRTPEEHYFNRKHWCEVMLPLVPTVPTESQTTLYKQIWSTALSSEDGLKGKTNAETARSKERWLEEIGSRIPQHVIVECWNESMLQLRRCYSENVRQTEWNYQQYIASLRHLAPHLPVTLSPQAYIDLREGEGEIHRYTESDRAEIIVTLLAKAKLDAKQVNAFWEALIAETLEEIKLLSGEKTYSRRAPFLCHIFRRMPDEWRSKHVGSFLEVIHQLHPTQRGTLLTNLLPILPKEIQPRIWLEAIEVTLSVKGYSIELRQLLQYFSDLYTSIIAEIHPERLELDWNAPGWVSLGEVYHAQHGLALLLTVAPKEFVAQTWQNIVRTYPHYSRDLKPICFVVLAQLDLPMETRKELIVQMATQPHETFSAEIYPLIQNLFPNEDDRNRQHTLIWDMIQEASNYKYEPDTDKRNIEQFIWALIPFLSQSEYIFELFKLATADHVFRYANSIEDYLLGLIDHIPEDSIPEVWRKILDLEKQRSARSYSRSEYNAIRAKIIPRIPTTEEGTDLLLDGLVTSPITRRIPIEERFTCRFDKYLRYNSDLGAYFLEVDNEIGNASIPRELFPHFVSLYVGSFLAYVIVPTACGLWFPVVLLKRILNPLLRPLTAMIKVLGRMLLSLLVALPRRIGDILLHLVGWLLFPFIYVYRFFGRAAALYGKYVRQYVLSSKQARDELEKVIAQNSGRLFYKLFEQRALLQVAGGWRGGGKLRESVGQAFDDANDWWLRALGRPPDDERSSPD